MEIWKDCDKCAYCRIAKWLICETFESALPIFFWGPLVPRQWIMLGKQCETCLLPVGSAESAPSLSLTSTRKADTLKTSTIAVERKVETVKSFVRKVETSKSLSKPIAEEKKVDDVKPMPSSKPTATERKVDDVKPMPSSKPTATERKVDDVKPTASEQKVEDVKPMPSPKPIVSEQKTETVKPSPSRVESQPDITKPSPKPSSSGSDRQMVVKETRVLSDDPVKKKANNEAFFLHKRNVNLLATIDRTPISTSVALNIKSANKDAKIEMREVWIDGKRIFETR